MFNQYLRDIVNNYFLLHLVENYDFFKVVLFLYYYFLKVINTIYN